MKNLCERFAPLMAETLHYASAPEGLERPLSEAAERLAELAERERALPACASGQSSTPRRDLEQARFAVFAWADEQMMSSQRAEASSWAAMSLQYRYFGTAEAGRLFYQELEKCLDSCGVPRRARLQKSETAEEERRSDGDGIDLGACAEPERDEWRELDLAERFEAAASRHREGDDEGALGVFALCLLCGFRGALYGNAAQLAHIRRACRGLFDRAPELKTPPSRRRTSELLVWGERAAYVVLPLLVCILFALYCGGVLANAPFHSNF